MSGAGAGVAFIPSDLDTLGSWVSSLAAADVARLADGVLEETVLATERLAARLDALRAVLSVELAGRDITDTNEGMRTGAWIAAQTHTPTNVARQRVRVATELHDSFEGFAQALAAGRIGWAHVEQICASARHPTAAEHLASIQDELLELVPTMTFTAWQNHVRRVARHAQVHNHNDRDRDINKAYDAGERGRADRLEMRQRPDGTVTLKGRFSGVNAAKLTHILDTATDRRWRQARDLQQATCGETTVPTRCELRAEALIDLLADTTTAATHVQVVLHTQDSDPGWFTTPDGHHLTADDVACDLCDAAYQLLTLDPADLPLRLGRSARLATPAQRRAAYARDGGCVFPGCETPPRWCDLHHVEDWYRGGDTDIELLATLCRHHHGVTHRKGWTMVATGDGAFTWTTPTGRTLHSQRHGTQGAGPRGASP